VLGAVTDPGVRVAARPVGPRIARISRPEVSVGERKERRKRVVLGVPAVIVGVLTIVALSRVSGVPGREAGATGTMGLNPDRRATLERVEVRQLTSERTFWVGAAGEDPIFIVSDRPVRFEPGAEVTITGRVEAAPADGVAARDWGVGEATVRQVRERGVYVRALRIAPAR
jgi:hypothetical protein